MYPEQYNEYDEYAYGISGTAGSNIKNKGDKVNIINSLPTIEEAGIIAVSLSEHLTAQEQAFFVAGFQECIKYLLDQCGELKYKCENCGSVWLIWAIKKDDSLSSGGI